MSDVCVRCTVRTRKAAVATGCQVMRNGRGHSAETLTLQTPGHPLRRGQTPPTVAQSRALTAGNTDSVMRAPEARFRKGQVACPWGPRQLSDTITYTVPKHMYKDTLIHRGKVKQRGTKVERARERWQGLSHLTALSATVRKATKTDWNVEIRVWTYYRDIY